MLVTGLITVAAFILIGRGASAAERKPLPMAAGFILLALSLGLHAANHESAMSSITALSAEFGIGFWILAGMLSKVGRPAKPFFTLGALTLAIAVVLIASGKLRSAIGVETILVELGPDDRIEEVEHILERHDALAERAYPTVTLAEDADLAQVFLVTVPVDRTEELIGALSADRENVDHTEVNRLLDMIHPVSAPGVVTDETEAVLENDPLVGRQWALDAINGHEAHALLKDATPVKKAVVAILDTGVDGRHEDLNGSWGSGPAGVDKHGHGSHCAGIAGAVTNNGIGIASLNWEGRFVEVAGYAALNEQGFGTIEMISQAVIDAVKDDVDVISMSLGDRSPTSPKSIRDAVEFALANDVIVIASAGNANEDAKDHMPSNIDGVIVVSAVDENLEKAKFSNTNTSLARPITAPGVNILSLKTDGGYVEMSGTSMSTPVVSGLVGVMRAFNPDITDEDVYRILQETGTDVKDTRRIGRLIDAEAAIKAVMPDA